MKKFVQLVLAILESEFVSRVHDPDKSVGLFKVIAPVRSDCGLTANIPNIEFESHVLDCFNLKAEGWCYF